MTALTISTHLKTLSFYRSLLDRPIIQNFIQLLSSDIPSSENYYTLKSTLLEWTLCQNSEKAYGQTPWKNYLLSQILHSENTLSFLFEKQQLDATYPFYQSILHDFQVLYSLYSFDWNTFINKTHYDTENIFSVKLYTLSESKAHVADAFDSGDNDQMLKAVNHYIFNFGLGIFETYTSFKLTSTGALRPILQQTYKSMDTLIGYDNQKKELIANTASFIHNQTGLNVLLQGDMGTGKSTMVKSLLTTFKHTRLKMIEIKKDQLSFIPSLIHTIKQRPYPFILFIDDLSFEEHDEDYKIFKNVLEGSLDENPKNLLIYATSNKRHLVTETRTERENAVHTKDVMEEKLSLSSRFGLVLTFSVPDQKNYLAIVSSLAQEAGLTMPSEELHKEAIKWEMRHLNRSGRTAEQFINYLKVSESAKHL